MYSDKSTQRCSQDIEIRFNQLAPYRNTGWISSNNTRQNLPHKTVHREGFLLCTLKHERQRTDFINATSDVVDLTLKRTR